VRSVTVVAPGKLFVIGEYAVLAGGRALLVAVDAGIRCELRLDGRHRRLVAPDLGLEAPLAEAEGLPGGRLLAVAASRAAREFEVPGGFELRIEGAHPASRRKLGLGGSAAATVAVFGAFAAVSGADLSSESTRRRLFQLADGVHRENQNGRGSGADVATSVYGGWVAYERSEGGPRIERLAADPGLALLAAWAGVAAETTSAIAQAERSLASWLLRLREPLERFWRALEAADVEEMLAAVSAYGEALDGSSLPGALRIRELVTAARRAGVAAKGSGALGGDCAIAVAAAPSQLPPVVAAWRRLGAEVLALSVDPIGVRQEVGHA
jgi:phosphomevalonate kinase